MIAELVMHLAVQLKHGVKRSEKHARGERASKLYQERSDYIEHTWI